MRRDTPRVGGFKSHELSLFLGHMNYESVSGVVVLVIFVMLVVVWLPNRTVDSMRKAQKHQEDKYSSSLHLVDAHSGTRFSDDSGPSEEGTAMRSNETGHAPNRPVVGRKELKVHEEKRVAHVRELRRAAARRRAIIATGLLIVSIAVLAIAFPLHFSPLFALIPAALLAVVLVAGARASKHAREWERNLKARNAAKSQQVKPASRTHRVDRRPGHVVADADANRQVDRARGGHGKTVVSTADDQPTGVLETSEIRSIVEQSKRKDAGDRARTAQEIEAPKANAADESEARISGSANRVRTKAGAVSEIRVEAEDAAGSSKPASAGNASSDKPRPGEESKTAVSKTDKPNASRSVVTMTAAAKAALHAESSQIDAVPDATNELQRVHPAGALNVVDMAPTNQDLISFSLGAPRNPQTATQEPQSLEIKSTRQVAKAVPSRVEEAAADANATKASATDKGKNPVGKSLSEDKSGARVDESSRARGGRAAESGEPANACTFHDAELAAKVEAPAVSSDSLGTGLESILARRGA